MTKKKKDDNVEYFVQLGMRKNGRIVKNEQFPLEMLAEMLTDLEIDSKVIIEARWFDRVFHWGKVKSRVGRAWKEGSKSLQLDLAIKLYFELKELIDLDNFGKKFKKK